MKFSDLKIGTKILLLTGFILLLMAGSLFYVFYELGKGTQSMEQQRSALSRLELVSSISDTFSDMRYWLVDLSLSWQNESEENAGIAKEKLDKLLKQLETTDKKLVQTLQPKVDAFFDIMMRSVDSYVDENRVLGNSLIAEGRNISSFIEQELNKLLSASKALANEQGSMVIAGSESIKSTSLLLLFIATFVGAILSWLFARSISQGMASIARAIKKMAKGDLKQDKLKIRSKDEIGQLRVDYNTMLETLKLFSDQAQGMAKGEFQVGKCKENLGKGMDFDSATNFVEEKYQATKGDLADALDNLTGNLRKLAVQSVSISGDQLDDEVLKESIEGELGESFAKMSKKMSWFAGQAQYIAQNDLYNENLVDNGDGTLGSSMSTMVKNLRSNVSKMAYTDSLMNQLPVNILAANLDFEITYQNPISRDTLKKLEQYMPIKVDDMMGSSIDIFHKNPSLQRKILSDPKNLPHKAQIQVGPEVLDLQVSATIDENGNYAGPVVTWTVITEQVKMQERERENHEKLQKVMNHITENAQTLASASEELTANSQQMANNAEETSAQSNVVSAASEEVNKNIQTVATGTEEMSASIQEIAKNSNEAAKVTNDAVEMAKSTNEIVGQLNTSSGEIGNVVKSITSIAEQTNLLALNATIEAARAGEAGKGFAVVANEVKELANQTSKATEDISGKIQAIQGDTGKAIDAIGNITDIINKINDICNTIASAVEEQTATTAEMARSVGDATRGANEIRENIAGVATTAAETTQGAADGQAAAVELSKLANELMSIVQGQKTD